MRVDTASLLAGDRRALARAITLVESTRADHREEADALEAEAEAFAEQARTNVQRATNYVLCVVLFAAALFFAGMSAKLRTRRLRAVLFAFGLIVFVGTVIWIATFPVSVSI